MLFKVSKKYSVFFKDVVWVSIHAKFENGLNWCTFLNIRLHCKDKLKFVKVKKASLKFPVLLALTKFLYATS